MKNCTEGHEGQCTNARPETECKCECGGENHGKDRILRREEREKRKLNKDEGLDYKFLNEVKII